MKSALMLTVVLLAAFCFLAPQLPPEKDAPPKDPAEKPAAPQEKPAVPVGGLLAEVKVLNAPIYPGDDVEVEVRLTNAQKEGALQIVDYPMIWVAFHPVVIGPDGQQIIWPEPKMPIKIPEAPMATLAPGAFYGRKITLGAAQLKKLGRYSLTYRYGNGMDLKDKGYSCWTGNVETNTVFFEVADFANVPAVDGIKMFVKMKPQYREDEPVMIEVRLYNAGEKEKEVGLPGHLLIGLSNGEVKDEKGKVVTWQMADVKAAPFAMVKIAPGQATSREYDLRAQCTIPAGKYSFQLHSNVSGVGEMTSNEVSFEILAAEKPVEKPVKPAPPQEKPAKPVNGLKAEVAVVDAPVAGGRDIKIEFRLHNVLDNEAIQIRDYPIPTWHFHPTVIGPDGKEVRWFMMEVGAYEESKLIAVTVKPGESYTKTVSWTASKGFKVGNYTITFRYRNSEALKDKGFNFWTGVVESNTVTFEVVDFKPAKPVNGLLGEVKILNAPIYPGDDIEASFRLTNVQKEGDIQIIDFPILGITVYPMCVGPDGKQISWPMPMLMPRPPDAPTATIKPGASYERKITLSAADLKKPGKYSLSFRYSNGEALADKGFNCWTGNLETNTVVFEVADVDAPADANGMKMFIKMKPRYQENKPVTITVYLYNSGDNEKEVRPLSEHLLWLSNGELKDEKGVVPQSNNPDFVDTPRANVKLASHRAVTSEYDLRTAYHELPVGKYTYQLHSTNPGMVSNEVSFEIVAPEKPKDGEEPKP